MSGPEIQRQVRQQRADIDALYELVQGVDHKVDALDAKLDRRVDELDAKFAAKFDQIDTRFDGIDGKLNEMGGQLADVLRLLGDR